MMQTLAIIFRHNLFVVVLKSSMEDNGIINIFPSYYSVMCKPKIAISSMNKYII